MTREVANSAAIPGGFAALYPIFRRMEEQGHIRRGYFVSGLGGAQFATDGTAERLRSLNAVDSGAGRSAVSGAVRSPVGAVSLDAGRQPPATGPEPRIVVLDVCDPASWWGNAVAWPQPSVDGWKPSRSAGCTVVVVNGTPVAYVDRKCRKLWTFEGWDHHAARWLPDLISYIGRRVERRIEVWQIDGAQAAGSVLAGLLVDNGFVVSYRGLALQNGSNR